MQTPEKPRLHALTVIITRPRQQATYLQEALKKLGATPVLLPSVEIVGRAPSHTLTHIQSQDIVIFLSANAVWHTQSLWESVTTEPTLLAVGPATARALKPYSAQIPHNDYSSRGLLKLSALQNIAGKTVYLCCGENTKPHLAKVLTKRGATVVPIISYERIRSQADPTLLQTLQNERPTCTVTTSEEGLRYFYETMQHAQLSWLLTKPLLIANPRHRRLAEHLGFTHVLSAENPTDAEILTTLQRAYP